LIGKLRDLEPLAVNKYGETPFHVAALNPNPDSIVAMLDNFPKIRFDIETNSKEHVVGSELVSICAGRGCAEVVGRLIRRGADIERGDVLRALVDESVRNPSKFQQLVDVYDELVKDAVVWRRTKTGERALRQDSKECRDQTIETVLHLLTKPSAEDDKQSVMEHIMHVGAGKFLRAILNTPGVFRFDKTIKAGDKAGGGVEGQHCSVVTYDVADFTPLTRSNNVDDNQFKR